MQRIQGWVEQGGVVDAIQGPQGPPGPQGPIGPPGSTITAILGPGYVSAADFPGADAGVKIAAAIAALTGVGGGTVDARSLTGTQSMAADPFAAATVPVRLLLGEATYQHATVISPNSGSSIVGSGIGATILQATDITHSVAMSAVRFVGVSNGSISDLQLLCNAVTRRTNQDGAAIAIRAGSSNIAVHDVFINGSNVAGVYIDNSHDIRVWSCRLQNTLADGVYITNGAYNVIVSGCEAYNLGDDNYAISTFTTDPAGQAHDVIFIGNLSQNSLANGVACIGGKNVTIVGNRIFNPASNGVAVQFSSVFSSYNPSNVNVVGNQIGLAVQTNFYSINVLSATHVQVTDNLIDTSNDLLVNGNCTTVSVRGNQIRSVNAAARGIQITTTSGTHSDIVVENNTVDTCQYEGVVFDNVVNGYVSNNRCFNCQSIGTNTNGTIDVVGCTNVFGFGNLVLGTTGLSFGSIRVASSTATVVTSLDQRNLGIPFWGPAGLSSNNLHLFWDDANRFMGINTAAPVSQLDVRSTAPANYGILAVANSDATKFLSLISGNSGQNNQFFGFSGLSLQFGQEGSPVGGGFATAFTILPTAIQLVSIAFAQLPASPVRGMIADIFDASTTTWGAAVAGGGAGHALIRYNGSGWTVVGV